MMTFPKPLRIVALAALAALALLGGGVLAGTGCREAKTVTPPPCQYPVGYLPQSSPANVLSNLRTAYVERNIDEYRKLFAPDFTFVFAVGGMEPDHPVPHSWGLVDELASAGHLFSSEFVREIHLVKGTTRISSPADSASYGPNAWQVWLDGVNLELYTNTDDGEVWIARGAVEAFYFRADPTRLTCEGDPTWLIFRWEDMPSEARKSVFMHWGDIKSEFR